jgi:predicted phosphodiesterase
MATVIRREFYNVKRNDGFVIVPVGDIHLGAAACDESALKRVIERIANDPYCYWICMGDVCDFINVSDPRFDASSMADWITIKELGDVASAQRDKFLGYIEPIAHKCLAVVKGNHEEVISRKYERDIFLEIVSGIKRLGDIPQNQRLGVGVYGWLRLAFYRSKKGKRKDGYSKIDINLHHGFTGGRLAGAKALNMQRWLWSHACDIAIFGHSHNISSQPEAVEYLDRNDNIRLNTRRGCFSGTFLKTVGEDTSTYSERKGYLPLPVGGCEIRIKPRSGNISERIRIVT